MKYLKMLGAVVLAMAALSSFASGASATALTTNGGQIYGNAITAVSEPIPGRTDNHAIITGPLGISARCEVHLVGNVAAQTPAAQTVKITLTKTEFVNCTNGYAVTTLKAGELEVHTDPNNQIATGNGTVTSNGTEITVHTPLGFNCIYATNATHLGTLTGSNTTGGHATLDIQAAAIARTGHSPLCGAGGEFNGRYTFTIPAVLNVH